MTSFRVDVESLNVSRGFEPSQGDSVQGHIFGVSFRFRPSHAERARRLVARQVCQDRNGRRGNVCGARDSSRTGTQVFGVYFGEMTKERSNPYSVARV